MTAIAENVGCECRFSTFQREFGHLYYSETHITYQVGRICLLAARAARNRTIHPIKTGSLR